MSKRPSLIGGLTLPGSETRQNRTVCGRRAGRALPVGAGPLETRWPASAARRGAYLRVPAA